MKNIEKVQRNILIFYYSLKIKDIALRKAFIEASHQLAFNKDIAELAHGIINGTITL